MAAAWPTPALAACVLLVAAAGCEPSGREEPPPGALGDAALPADEPDAALEPMCGDGVLQPGETCDPPSSCPTTCPTITCKAPAPSGSPFTCDVACDYTPITLCIGGDGCCPSGCDDGNDVDCSGIRIDGYYANDYQLRDLGAVPGVPTRLGGLTPIPGDPDHLLVGGSANTMGGGLYQIEIVRDAEQHIIAFTGVATRVADAPYNDGGIVFSPEGVLFHTGWPANTLAQVVGGSGPTTKLIDLDPFMVAYSAAGATFVPAGYPGSGALKLMSWSGGQWYEAALKPDGNGTMDVTAVELRTTLTGGPEGMVYVPMGSPLFGQPAVLISEWSAGTVSTYEVDDAGDPVLGTRRPFVINLQGAEGAAIDPTSGDFLFSTFGGGDRVIVVRGFAPIE